MLLSFLSLAWLWSPALLQREHVGTCCISGHSASCRQDSGSLIASTWAVIPGELHSRHMPCASWQLLHSIGRFPGGRRQAGFECLERESDSSP